MKAIAYLRFSSDPQEKGSSIERQTEHIERYLSSRPGFELENTFVDDGYSASKGEHLSSGHFGRILADVDSGKYRGYALIVEKMDRFSRADIDETSDYIRRLTKGGVEFHLAASSRIVNPPGKQLGTVIQNVVEAWQAEDYVKNLTANVTRGWKRIMDEAATGRVLTRRVPDWLEVVGRTYNGAKITNPGRIVEKPERVAVVREAFRLAALGVGSENIARALNGSALTRSWIVKTLKNRAVLGEFRPGKTGDVIENYFPQIIDQAQFDAARKEMNAKRRNGKSGKVTYAGGRRSDTAANLFSGLMFDVTSEPERTIQFQTVNRGKYLMSAFDPARKQNRMSYDRLERAMLSFFEAADWQKIVGQTQSDGYKEAVAGLEIVLGKIDKITRRIVTTKAAMESDDIDVATIKVLASQAAKAEAELATLTAEKDALEATVGAERAKCESIHTPERLMELIKDATPEAVEVRRRLKLEIAKRVSRIEINFNEMVATITLINGYHQFLVFQP
jgi:DNA invertase Pin-like site-specific DNA recombinase